MIITTNAAKMNAQMKLENIKLKELVDEKKQKRGNHETISLKIAGISTSLPVNKVTKYSGTSSSSEVTGHKVVKQASSTSKLHNEAETKKKSGARANLAADVPPLDNKHQVKFHDIAKVAEGTSGDWTVLFCKNVQKLSAEDILTKSCEKSYDRVFTIELNGQRLERIENLDKFRAVRILDLSSNFIHRIENLGSCKELRELKLYGNAIAMIENLDGLKELQCLHLQHNQIKSIGNGLTGVSKLKVLRLDFNQISKLTTQELSSCTCLTSLDLSYNLLDNIQAVSCLINLEELHASHNNLKSVADLSRCKRLEDIDVSLNPLTDLSGLKGMSSLKIVNASQTHLKSVTSLGPLPTLEQLKLSQCRLTELKSISLLYPAVQVLDVSSNSISDLDEIIHLSALKTLIELSISGNVCCSTAVPGSTSYIDLLHRRLPSLTLLDSIPIESMASASVSEEVITARPQSATPLTARTSRSLAALPPVIRPRTVMGIQPPSMPIVESDDEAQFASVQAQLSAYEADLSAKFAEIKASLKKVPSKLKSHSMFIESDTERLSPRKFPSAVKSKMRQRLLEAREFSANFDDP